MTSALSSELVFFLFSSVLLLGVGEIGYRCGLRVFALGDDVRQKLIGGIEQATLGLLALLLGFTFALALSRFDVRRELVVKEANTIYTTWLRAALLPEPHPAAVRDLLRRYVDGRMDFHGGMEGTEAFAKAVKVTAELQAELWRHAVDSAKEVPNDVTATFLTSLNDTIDTGADRIAAGRARIPRGVTVLLLIVAAFGCFTSNYGAGSLGKRFVLNAVLLPLIIAITTVMIFDFDNTRQGFIRLSIEPLQELQASLAK